MSWSVIGLFRNHWSIIIIELECLFKSQLKILNQMLKETCLLWHTNIEFLLQSKDEYNRKDNLLQSITFNQNIPRQL